MNDPFDSARLEELRQRTTPLEYEFTSAARGVGGLVVRFREAWNSVATKWQVRPMMARQSAFNRALVDWLERPPGLAELDAGLVEHDRKATALNRDVGLPAARTRRLRGDVAAVGVRIDPAGRRLRIAYFSPMPPSRSGIADYSAELLPRLAERADVTVFTDDPAPGQFGGLPARPPADYPGCRGEFDLPLYHMGNSEYHESIYEMLTRHPGGVVLHDYFLHHFIRHHIVGHGDWVGYSRELAYSLGSEGRKLGRAIGAGQAAAPLFDLPLSRRVIDGALGLIVHSEYVANRVRRERPGIPLAVVPALVEARPGRSRRAELGLPDDAILFGSFGQMTAEKQIELTLRVFRQIRETFPTAHYLLAGEAMPDVDIAALSAELGLNDSVRHVGYAPALEDFVDWIHTADVVINLRRPTVGETSAVALRAMAAARPLIVFDHGWYSELPDDAALKAAPGDAGALEAAMERLAASAELRRAMGEAALDYVRRNCSPRRVAAAYVDFLHAILDAPGTAHA